MSPARHRQPLLPNRLVSRWQPAGSLVMLWAAWLILHQRYGSTVLAVFFLSLAALLVLLRRYRLPMLAVALAAVLLLTSGVVDTWKALRTATLSVSVNILDPLTALSTSGSGLEVVSQEARQATDLLAEAQATTYRLSPALLENALFHQRIIELSWPRTLEPTSPYLLYLHQVESLPAGCTELARREHVALAACP